MLDQDSLTVQPTPLKKQNRVRSELSDTPVIFRFQRVKAFFFGVVTLVFFCVITASLIKAILLGDIGGLGFFVLSILCLSFGSAAIDYLWIVAQGPIAVQMDAQGLSCYKMPPVPWAEVKAVVALKGRKRHRYLGITLHDPKQYHTRLSTLARLRSRVWQWRYEQDIVVEGFLLRTGETEEIADAAQRFLVTDTK